MNQKGIVLQFPLRGEWQAPTTPAKQVPSHGTNRLGLRYAFDFLQVNWDNPHIPFHNISFLRYFLFGVPLKYCYCWGKEIYAPCDGEIVMIHTGKRERGRAHWLIDSMIAIKNALFFNERKHDYSVIAGNYIVMKYDTGVYIAFAHLQNDSIKVKINEKIKKGTKLGSVGHSGNSTSPHLHFQVMNSSDISKSQGIPCAFETYEVYENGKWIERYNSIPSHLDHIRFQD